jgi:hypothetical protein
MVDCLHFKVLKSNKKNGDLLDGPHGRLLVIAIVPRVESDIHNGPHYLI